MISTSKFCSEPFCLLILGVHMNILFIIKAEILVLILSGHVGPPNPVD